MNSIESHYVKNVYEQIGAHFSATRNGDKWSYVTDFIQSLHPNSLFIDLGCGNGKYIDTRRDIQYIAMDNCDTLLNCAQELYKDETHVIYLNGVIQNIPVLNEYVDNFISIAVFHHIYETVERFRVVQEMIRILKVNGRGMITVWSTNQNEKRFKKWKPFGTKHNDYLVPWSYREKFGIKGVNQQSNVVYYDRYYHIFSKDELLSYFIPYMDKISIVSIEEIHCNWVLIIQKK
jgi:ubiquinone/menaquinone biosynthesis C-methylase UbiE